MSGLKKASAPKWLIAFNHPARSNPLSAPQSIVPRS